MTSGGVTVIQTQSAEADALVKSLIATAGRAPVLLDHQIMGKPGPANVTLYYGCGPNGACSMTRIEVAALEGMAVLTVDTGVWLRDVSPSPWTGSGMRPTISISSSGRWARAARPEARSHVGPKHRQAASVELLERRGTAGHGEQERLAGACGRVRAAEPVQLSLQRTWVRKASPTTGPTAPVAT